MSRPHRLKGFSYIGPAQYFLTFCTYDRRATFIEQSVFDATLGRFRTVAASESFAILAYCFMPDHVHLLVEGLTESSDLRKLAKLMKQQSGAAHALRAGMRLWQEGYYDRVLRKEEEVKDVAGSILNNPVRAGLVNAPAEYGYLGSDVWRLEELLDSVA
jgi:putative transposase